MGKSPGKWIKTKLFGKKSSKSNLSKDTTLQKMTSISNDSMVISSPVPPVTHTTEEHSESHKTSTNPTTEVATSTTVDNSITLQQAAIKAQTAFRGYSARKELSNLKATILLQAHIRGHLVRKQQLHTKGNSVISTKTESFPEQSQSELEKVKQSLRKITISMAASAPPPNPEPESEPEHVPEPEPKLESEPEPDPVAMTMESSGRESMKTRRRSSFPVKHEHVESVAVSSPVLPSYMAATESAKAKLRAQAVAEDGGENGFVRRHSLPSSTGKVSLQSPRVQKPLGNGKGWSKSNKAQVCAKDDKTVQTGWKR